MDEFEIKNNTNDEPQICDVCKAPINNNKHSRFNIKMFTGKVIDHDIVIDCVCSQCTFMLVRFMEKIESSIVDMK